MNLEQEAEDFLRRIRKIEKEYFYDAEESKIDVLKEIKDQFARIRKDIIDEAAKIADETNPFKNSNTAMWAAAAPPPSMKFETVKVEYTETTADKIRKLGK